MYGQIYIYIYTLGQLEETYETSFMQQCNGLPVTVHGIGTYTPTTLNFCVFVLYSFEDNNNNFVMIALAVITHYTNIFTQIAIISFSHDAVYNYI